MGRAISIFYGEDNMTIKQAEKALAEVQKRSRARTIDAEKLAFYCEKAKTVFRRLISNADLKGVEIRIDFWAAHFPNAYYDMGVPESTVFILKHNGKEWRVEKIMRARCFPETVMWHELDENHKWLSKINVNTLFDR